MNKAAGKEVAWIFTGTAGLVVGMEAREAHRSRAMS